MKKRILYLCLTLLVFFTGGYQAQAASLSISASSKSVTIGSSVTVTVKASDLAGKFSVSSSDSSILSGGSSGTWLENSSESFKFTAKKEGSATITVKTISAASFSTGSAFSESKSITINVVKPREKSTNNNLKSLSVEGYNLSPEFNKDTLEYTTELPADATKIEINASKEDSYASITGTGEKEVQEGENRFEIVVTSETGSSKTYVIIANVKDNNPIEKEVDGKTLTVVKRSDSLVKPNDYFTEHKVTINDVEVPAFYNEKTNIVLIGLKDESGKIELYLYQEKEDKCEKYQSITSSNPTIIFKEATNIPSDYQKTTIKIEDASYEVYKSNKNKNYLLIYGLNIETGEENWYSYHEGEKTIQVYNSQEVENLTNEYDKKLEEYKLVIIVLGSLSILLLLIILILVLKKGKKTKLKKEINQSKEESQIAEENEENFLDDKPKKKKKK